MNAKQNMIFFIGLILMVMVFWVNGYWAILKQGITAKGTSLPPGTPVKPNHGKCPPGYTLNAGRCIPPLSQLPVFFG